MDPRLRWQQLVAPDLSGASQALARANQSFNRGFETANGVLAQYDTGQKEQADQALLSDLAGLGDEAEFDAFIDGGGLEGRNISSGLRDHVLGARTGFVRDAGVRANTDGTRARTAIAQAAEGRSASEYAYQDGRRRELAGLSGLIVGANSEGNQYGRGTDFTTDAPASLVRTESGGNFQATNNETGSGGRDGHFGRVQFGHDRFEEARSAGAVPAGMTIEEFTNDPDAQRSAENWHFADIQGFIDENGLDRYIGQEINGVTMTRDGLVAMAHLGGSAGMRRFLTSGGSYNPSDSFGTSLTDYASTHAGDTTARQSRPEFNRLQAALGGSEFLQPGDVTGLLSGAYEAQGIGQGRLDAAEAARIQATSDAAVLNSFSDPSVNGSDPASLLAAAQGAGLDDGSTLDLFGRIQGAAEANPNIFNPQAPTDPLIIAAKEAEAAEQARLANNTPEQRLLREAQNMDENPTQSIIKRFDMDLGVSEKEELDTMIDTLSDELKITRGEAALALSETHKAPNLIRFDTVRSRFSIDDAREFASTTFSTDARKRAGDAKAIQLRDSVQNESSINRLQKLESEALRYTAAGREVPDKISREITKTKDVLRSGSNPEAVSQKLSTYISRTGMSSRLEGLDPESPEFFRAMSDLETAIQGDRSLSADDKRLLISAIRG